jgi:hypothetical protein
MRVLLAVLLGEHLGEEFGKLLEFFRSTLTARRPPPQPRHR